MSSDSRLRIAFAVHDARFGGGQDRYAVELVNGLSRRHDVTLFACSASRLEKGVKFVPIEAAKRPLILRSHQFERRANRLIDSDSFDLVHTVGGALPGANVITAQFCHAEWLQVQRSSPSPLTGPATRWYRTAEARAAMRQEARSMRSERLRGLIGVSERVVSEWESAYQGEPSRRVVIPNAVDAQHFQDAGSQSKKELRATLGIPDDAFLLLLVGALLRKGVDTALGALAALPDRAHLAAIGAGPHHRVLALARAGGVADRLHLVNPVPDVERYFGAADALFFPTRYEPFGMVIAEAWAAGLPAICSSVAGALEWSRDGETAIHIESPTDAPGFAAAARRLMDDAALAERMAAAGQGLARQFTWERVVDETERFYENLL